MIPAGVLIVALSLVAGWAVLFPVRTTLGAVWYHLLAYPIGLLGWGVVLVVASLAGVSYSLGVLAAGLALFSAAGASLLWLVTARGGPVGRRRPVAAWTWVAAAAAALVASWAAAAFGASFSTDDSIMAYEALGLWLYDTGAISARLVSERSFLVPAVHAANRALGGSWGYVHYPVLGLTVALVVWRLVWEFSAGLTARTRVVLAIGVALALATTPSFVFHTFYVHSHMMTAAYLLVALVGLYEATGGDVTAEKVERPWLGVAGLSAAGMIVTRTDGLAYVFVVLALLGALYLTTGMGRRGAAAFFTPMLGYAALLYAAAVAGLGVWRSGKLKGRTSLALLGLMGAAWAAIVTVGQLPSVRRALGRRSRLLLLVGALDLVAMAAVAALLPADFRRFAFNAAGNLLRTGGYQTLWAVIFVLLVVSVVHLRGRLLDDWTGHLLFAVLQFLAIAFIVHVTSNPGRLSPSDSFSRVAFHIVPTAFAYVGLWASRLLKDLVSPPLQSATEASDA